MSNEASGPDASRVSPAAGMPHDLAQLRDDTCATLFALDNAAKARASIVRSCSEMKGLSAAEVAALKDLLRCITDQRKRMRAIRRLWQSIDLFERPSAELVEATNLCFTECRELASALDPLRAETISQMHITVSVTWTRLLKVASQFTTADERPALAHSVSYQGL